MPTDTLDEPRRVRPLLHFPVVSTRSLEEARDAVTRVYLPTV